MGVPLLIIHFNGFFSINQPFGGTLIDGNPHMGLSEHNIASKNDEPMEIDGFWGYHIVYCFRQTHIFRGGPMYAPVCLRFENPNY